jgi:hypothetical protein
LTRSYEVRSIVAAPINLGFDVIKRERFRRTAVDATVVVVILD